VRFAPKIGPSGLSQNLKHAHMESVTFKQSGLWVQTWTIDIMFSTFYISVDPSLGQNLTPKKWMVCKKTPKSVVL
jgi:hypothetical protein